ncbi:MULTISPECIES: hypothetical protein [unclassified Shewanella]|uniref:hypothetical protein n=1 Tax=unclassified Shewanella TaxID=196818 RepID=UPI0002E1EAAB|nr:MULTISPECIES: hypothetical protein [unclassified Shewanella]MDH0448697.1 hypothetical protein [Shewanella sp. GD04112]
MFQTERLSALLNQVRMNEPALHIEPNEYLYLAAMSLWNVNDDDDYRLVDPGYKEEQCNEIFSYVDRWLGQDDITSFRTSNFLKRAVEQGLVMQAGSSLRNADGFYRLTQLSHDLLKPFTGDTLIQKESLSQRYVRLEILLGNLLVLKIEDDEEWANEIKAQLPSFRDLLDGINKNQEALIKGFQLQRSSIQSAASGSLAQQMQHLIELIDEIAGQIRDLKSLILNGADNVLSLLHEIKEMAHNRNAPIRLTNAMADIHDQLDSIRQFSGHSLLELAEFFEQVLSTIRLKITLDPNANLNLLIEKAVLQMDRMPWSISILAPDPVVELRDWEAPPPPLENELPNDGDPEVILRKTPSDYLEKLAKGLVARMYESDNEVDISKVADQILSNEEFQYKDRHRLLFFIFDELIKNGDWTRPAYHPEWVQLAHDNNVEIEQQWFKKYD